MNNKTVVATNRVVVIRWSNAGMRKFLAPCQDCNQQQLKQILQVNNNHVNNYDICPTGEQVKP